MAVRRSRSELVYKRSDSEAVQNGRLMPQRLERSPELMVSAKPTLADTAPSMGCTTWSGGRTLLAKSELPICSRCQRPRTGQFSLVQGGLLPHFGGRFGRLGDFANRVGSFDEVVHS